MALDGHQEPANSLPQEDANCVSCVYAHNERIEETARMLGTRYENDAVQRGLKWDFPRHPKPCAAHRSALVDEPPREETTRMRAIRDVPAVTKPETPPANSARVHPPRDRAVSRPLIGQPPEHHLTRASLPSGDLRAIRESGRNQWRATGPLVPSESGKHAVPGWLLGATNSAPLFPKPQPLIIHKQQCPDCVGGTVYEPDGTFGPCARCKKTGWIEPEPKPDASLVAERYRLMAPPADRAAPQPLAAQPPQTGAMPALPAPKPAKLSSGEFPSLNAAMLRVMRGQAQLGAMREPFCAEVQPWAHHLASDAQSLADNVRMANDGLPREVELFWLNVENALRLVAEYAERIERDLRALPGLEARHAS